MINEREQEINAFLFNLMNYAKKNQLDDDFYKIIYKYMRSYNLGDEQNLDIKNRFILWINRFQSQKTTCINTEKWSYWCQFINEQYQGQTLKESDPVKLYIPLKSSHIYNGVNKIFDFCEQNNIIHQSKVASKMRNDNVVLRIKNIDDAVKVINFVNNDPYLKEGHLNPNPFCFQEGFVGLAIDNYNSYNDTVAKLLAAYIKQKKSYNNFNVSADDFYDFVTNYHHSYNTKQDMIYGEEIRSLILKSLKSNDFNVFANHYYSVVGNRNIKNQIDLSHKTDYDVISKLEDAVDVTIENHDENFARNSLYSYLTTGSTKGFSRYRNNNLNINYRGILSSFDYKMVLNQIMSYYGTKDINKIVNNVIKKRARV